MSEKIALSGVPETMLQTVYARAKESKGRGAIRDPKAVALVDRLDYDFSLADKDTVMRSGVIARTIVLDRLVEAWLAQHHGAVVVNIDQHHFGEQPALHQRKCGCGSHEPASHDANFAEIRRPRACLGAVCHELFSFVECRFAIVPQNGHRPCGVRLETI